MSGYEVSNFSDPLLAYEHIRDNPDKYSLIITDYRMPLMDGLFFATKLAEINKKLNMIIMMSDHDYIKCNYKFNIIKKPVSVLKLIKLVNESISISVSKKTKCKSNTIVYLIFPKFLLQINKYKKHLISNRYAYYFLLFSIFIKDDTIYLK